MKEALRKEALRKELEEKKTELQREKAWFRKMVNNDSDFNCSTFGKNAVTFGLRVMELENQIYALQYAVDVSEG